MKYKIKKLVRKVTNIPNEFLGVGVISNLLGRNVLYGAFALSFASVGLFSYALIFAGVMIVDVFIHVQVLQALLITE